MPREAAGPKAAAHSSFFIVMVVCGCERSGWASSLSLLLVVTNRYNNDYQK